ncbi:MAG: hypothetical protein GF331_09220, partial [Chitinivibrionales bacterium]|nr:hypothetical protein [Chitinivibrionales bacterium]
MTKTTAIWLCTTTILGAHTMAAESDSAWQQRTRRRIEQHRRSRVTVRVLDKEGKPRKDVPVRLRMQRHDFAFGTAVKAKQIAKLPEDDPYKRTVRELFNTVVFGNSHKWEWWENPGRRKYTHEAMAWVRDAGLRLRGHTMIWQSNRFKPLPKDIEAAIASGADSLRPVARQRSLDHIAEIGAYCRDAVYEWDVLNEQVEHYGLTDYLNPGYAGTDAPVIAEWYREAARAAPGARLYLNEYHILVGDYAGHKDRFEQIIENLLARDAPLGGLGFQCHFHGRKLLRSPQQTYATLERFGRFGLPMLITEYDTFGGGWAKDRDERERQEARFLEQFLPTVFSHPLMAGFVVWGFWDGKHWADNAPFFREDWTPKPALDVYRRLV